MTKSVQILLLFALLPMVGMAREETLEERKQRIVRKYLRQRTTMDQSSMHVPTGIEEDERITDSEKFKGAEVNLQREDSTATPMLPPPRQRRPVPRTEQNWLLADAEEATDAYGRPIDSYTDATMDSGDDLWSVWDGSSREKTATELDRRDRNSYDPNGSSSYGRQNNSGRFDSRGQQSSSLFGNQQSSGAGNSEQSTRVDIFGRKQSPSTYSSSLIPGNNTPRVYGSNPEQGMLNSPFPQMHSSGQGRSTEEEHQNYKPYKSPYEQQREERRQQKTIPAPKEPEFKRNDSYQQWKDRNKTWDPTSDDAYITEMMKQNKR